MLWRPIFLNAIVKNMLEEKRIGAILLMGGSGLRFGSSLPKQFHRLAGKCIYLHTLEAFLKVAFFDEMILCCHRDWMARVQESLPDSSCPIRVVEGGKSRQESSLRGLLALKNSDVVVIHDAVRPFVSQEILLQNAKMALLHGAIDTCIPSTDTLVHAPNGRHAASIPPRSEFLRGQTPQSFAYSLVLDAHLRTRKKDASDDCQLVLEAGHRVHVVQGSESNLKITSEQDLLLAEHLLRLKRQEAKASVSISLRNKRFLIIGGTGGIGKAVAKRLEEVGAEVICLSRKTEPPIDLCHPASIAKGLEQVGKLDGLINCAGKLSAGLLDKLNLAEIEEMLSVNLKGLIFCCRLAQLKRGAHVINIASSSYSRGRKEMCVYSSAKAGVVNFTQGWAEERPDLHIHAVIPQRTDTPLRRENFPGEDSSSLLDPDTVADTVLSLLQDNESTGLLVEVKKQETLTALSCER